MVAPRSAEAVRVEVRSYLTACRSELYLDPPMTQPTERIDFAAIEHEERPQAKRIAEYFRTSYHNATILDVGCGPGLYVEEMRAAGLQAFGVDNDDRLFESSYLHRSDITSASPMRTAGIVLSLEVGEHIPERSATTFVEYIALTNADWIYFSAAHPGQGGVGHVNCQPKSYWVSLFCDHGYFFHPEETDRWIGFIVSGYHMGWLRMNGMVFRKQRTFVASAQ